MTDEITPKKAYVLFRNNRPGIFVYDTKESAKRIASGNSIVVEMVSREELALQIESLVDRCTVSEAVIVRACANIVRGQPELNQEAKDWAVNELLKDG